MIFDLPQGIYWQLFCEWLTIVELCRLDSAFPIRSSERSQLLTIFIQCPSGFKWTTCSTKLSSTSFRRWLKLRNVALLSFVDLKFAHSTLVKAIPSLVDVVGSTDDTAHESFNLCAAQSAYDYTASSLKSVADCLGLCGGSGKDIRIFDGRCGSSIFITLLQMCYPEAEVMGVDQSPMICTLNAIQKYCRRRLYQDMYFQSASICSPEFKNYLLSFAPTIVICLAASHEEETHLLTTIKDVSSVTTIALAQRRGRGELPGFEECGFQLRHRVPVQAAGTRRRRFVLIACRQENTNNKK